MSLEQIIRDRLKVLDKRETYFFKEWKKTGLAIDEQLFYGAVNESQGLWFVLNEYAKANGGFNK